ncbi:MAG: universal stress protein [Leptolyngbyaceae cyanobacterium]
MTLFSSDSVLVPMDFSDDAIKALKNTLEFIDDPQKIHVLNVLPSLEATEPGVIWQTVDTDTRVKKVEETYQSHFPEAPYRDMTFTIKIGNPSSEIIDYAKQNDIGLIVIPSSGKAGLSRFFMGSVAEKVVRFSHCPVLVIRE